MYTQVYAYKYDIFKQYFTKSNTFQSILTINMQICIYNKNRSIVVMKTIAIINQKGGVGKSTTVSALGAGLRLRGNRVLFIDLDAQGNLSHTMNAQTKGYNAMGVIQYPLIIRDEIQHTQSGDILASSGLLSGADLIVNQTGKEYKLKEALGTVERFYDFVIVDTPPALGILTINALTACDGAIVPAQADIYSLQGINQLSTTIGTVKSYCNRDLKILGVLLTRYNARTIISREVAEIVEQVADGLKTKLYDTKIRECTAIKEAQASRQDIFEYAPKCNAALDYNKLIDEILSEGI